MTPPDTCRYTPTHEWIRLDSNNALVGITDHAQSELSDVVFVELPAIGRTVKAGEAVAVVESVKAASDIYAPVDGTIAAVNDALGANPALVNQQPHGDGWLYRLTPANPSQIDSLLTADAYAKKIAV